MDVSIESTNTTNSVSDGTASPPHSPTASSSILDAVSTNASFNISTLVYVSNTSSITDTAGLNTLTGITNINSIPTDLSEFLIQETGLTISGNSSGISLNTFLPVVPEITERLNISVVEIEDCSNNSVLDQIKYYAGQIHCSEFHGKGTVEDYSVLFDAASRIVKETKQVQLDIDVEGFNEFSRAADELGQLFENFTIRLQNVNIIDDSVFLQSILTSLIKIDQLSNKFGKFKETILATSTIQLPCSVEETRTAIEDVTGEINCAMRYINHFVSPTGPLINSELSSVDKNAITKAAATLDAWGDICEQGVTLSMSHNPDIIYIKQANDVFRQQATILRSSTSNLRNRYSAYFPS
jgi:hypothetical protein